ncbi:methyltransferase family protein [Salana multivorans]|uniref:Methyltransferase family protein n=1 Tax=Salana multivorans TaxID=120377 RepID=A0A3N2D7X4_9MICO|nr:class I SAM-dependent methyltransferase [Salana multivorans]ROR95893.1 methyltransferase family protein [Salana multivorans]
MSAPDPYAATAGLYDLVNASFRAGQTAAVEALLPLLRPDEGPVLDVGAGSGLNLALVLDRLPRARVVALEPSAAMRSLALARVAARPEWFDRVTVRPEDFFSAQLPERLGGAIALGVVGHFDAGERAAVLAELAARLPRGGAALIDLQDPPRPARVEAREFTVARVGELDYRGIAEAWPVDLELMRWRMTYLTLEGERVLVEETAELDYRHPAPDVVAREAAEVGLGLDRLGETTYWLLTRD